MEEYNLELEVKTQDGSNMTKTWDDVRKKYIKKFTCAGGTKDCRLPHDRCFADNANHETVDKYFTTAFYQIMEELREEIENIKFAEHKRGPFSLSPSQKIHNELLNEVLSLIPKCEKK